MREGVLCDFALRAVQVDHRDGQLQVLGERRDLHVVRLGARRVHLLGAEVRHAAVAAQEGLEVVGVAFQVGRGQQPSPEDQVAVLLLPLRLPKGWR